MKPFAAAGITILVFAGILASPQPLAQSTTPAFEVATVKPNRDGSGLISFGFEQGGRFRAVNTPLRLLVRLAYEVQDFQILGGPGWFEHRSFRHRGEG